MEQLHNALHLGIAKQQPHQHHLQARTVPQPQPQTVLRSAPTLDTILAAPVWPSRRRSWPCQRRTAPRCRPCPSHIRRCPWQCRLRPARCRLHSQRCPWGYTLQCVFQRVSEITAEYVACKSDVITTFFCRVTGFTHHFHGFILLFISLACAVSLAYCAALEAASFAACVAAAVTSLALCPAAEAFAAALAAA